MAAKKRGARKTTRKKGQHFATLSKKIPKDHLAFVVGNEVRVVKRKKTARKSRRK
jgi:hypothetical protein